MVGLVGRRGHPFRGAPHLVRGLAQRFQCLADLAFEIADVALDGALTRLGLRAAPELLGFDPGLLFSIDLELGQCAGQRAYFVAAPRERGLRR
ncbi:MAG: hypothetical protein WDN69_17805 [Aliidongia sp.]